MERVVGLGHAKQISPTPTSSPHSCALWPADHLTMEPEATGGGGGHAVEEGPAADAAGMGCRESGVGRPSVGRIRASPHPPFAPARGGHHHRSEPPSRRMCRGLVVVHHDLWGGRQAHHDRHSAQAQPGVLKAVCGPLMGRLKPLSGGDIRGPGDRLDSSFAPHKKRLCWTE